VQLPGGQGTCSGGDRRFVPCLARAAAACGCQGLFLETHPEPERALCDGPNSWPLATLEPLLREIQALWNLPHAPLL
jgi:2-dehydro-3-deoxyphosphooctonate aldolase (KDO 8-P synthase)